MTCAECGSEIRPIHETERTVKGEPLHLYQEDCIAQLRAQLAGADEELRRHGDALRRVTEERDEARRERDRCVENAKGMLETIAKWEREDAGRDAALAQHLAAVALLRWLRDKGRLGSEAWNRVHAHLAGVDGAALAGGGGAGPISTARELRLVAACKAALDYLAPPPTDPAAPTGCGQRTSVQRQLLDALTIAPAPPPEAKAACGRCGGQKALPHFFTTEEDGYELRGCRWEPCPACAGTGAKETR